jgi:cysteinyl-tRNA synthetase
MQKFQLGLDERDEIVAFMKRIDSVFALLDFPGDILGEDIAALVAEREEARRLKNFTRSDEIRDTLKTKGIVLEDTPSGVMWRRE